MNEEMQKIIKSFLKDNGYKNEKSLITDEGLDISNLKLSMGLKHNSTLTFNNQKDFFTKFCINISKEQLKDLKIIISLEKLTEHIKEPYFFNVLPIIKLSNKYRKEYYEKDLLFKGLINKLGIFNKQECVIINSFLKTEKLLKKPKDKENYYKLVTQKFPQELWKEFGVEQKEEISIEIDDAFWMEINKEKFVKQCNFSIICDINEYNYFIENLCSAMINIGIMNQYVFKKFASTPKDACLVFKTKNKQKVLDGFNYLLKHTHEKDLSLEKMNADQRIKYMEEVLKKYFSYMDLVKDIDSKKDSQNIKKKNIKI